jgi:O-methyltransferase
MTQIARKVKEEIDLKLTLTETAQSFSTVKDTAKIPGDIAEVGVYTGGSAKIVCEAKGDRTLHLFDTFEGLPQPSKVDNRFYKGQFNAPLEGVQNYL